MRLKFLLLILFIWQTGQSQIMVGYKDLKKGEKETFQRFKKTKTIFVLPDVYDKATYDSIIKSSWHVTPYEIVSKKDFNLNDYGGNQYSYVRIAGYKVDIYRDPKYIKNRKPVSFLFNIYLEIYMYNFDKLIQEINKLSPKANEEKKSDVFERNTIKVALISLYPKSSLNTFIKYNDVKEIEKRIYKKAEFNNYKLGFLKNYFQKINSLIQNEQYYWSYRRKYLPELKNLKNHILYIPDFVAMKHIPYSTLFEKPSQKYLDEIFKDYEFKYQLIDSDELNQKILNNEPIYYFLFVKLGSQHFYEIVNAQTGEFVYDNFKTSTTTNAKPKFIKQINKYIKKAAKK